MSAPSLPLAMLHALTKEPSLVQRLRVAVAIVAQEIFTEPPSTPGDPLRWNLARSVVSPTEDQVTGLVMGLVVSPSLVEAAAAAGSDDPAVVAAAITDEQIIAAVRAGWDMIAGVRPVDGNEVMKT